MSNKHFLAALALTSALAAPALAQTTTATDAPPATSTKAKKSTKTAQPMPAPAAPAATQTTPSTTPAPSMPPATTAPATAPATAAPAAAPAAAAPVAGQAATTPGAATANPMVGGVAMDATKPIPVNAAAAPNLTTLVKAATAAGLVETLSGPGPFTVFAPTNDAFTRLAPGTVDTLMKPESKPTLVKVLTYHVVPGALTVDQLKQQITAGSGTAKLKTVEGEELTLTMPTPTSIQIADVHGNKSFIETGDVKQSNGIVHVVNGVLLPTVNSK